MMFAKFENFLQNRTYKQGENLESEALIVAQKILVNSGADFIPKSYIELLKKYNGLKTDNICFFGATIDDDMDIVDRNEDTLHPENTIVLGYSDDTLLCFAYKLKKYQIIDRDTLQAMDNFEEDDLDSALMELCRG